MSTKDGKHEPNLIYEGAGFWPTYVTPVIECPDCGATNTRVLGFSCDHERCPMFNVPANEDEAQRGLNDTFPGDSYPAAGVLQGIRQRSVQALHAGISRRDWWATETAANELRNQIDDLIRRLNPR